MISRLSQCLSAPAARLCAPCCFKRVDAQTDFRTQHTGSEFLERRCHDGNDGEVSMHPDHSQEIIRPPGDHPDATFSAAELQASLVYPVLAWCAWCLIAWLVAIMNQKLLCLAWFAIVWQCGRSLRHTQENTKLMAKANSSVSSSVMISAGTASEQDSGSAAAMEERMYGTAESLDAYLDMVDERIQAERPPAATSEMASSGWVDCSKGATTLFLASRPKLDGEPFTRLSVCIKMKSADQVASFPLINDDGSGAAQIFLACEHWNKWFPFCNSCTLLKRFSPFRSIWLLKFKVAFITVECVVLAVLTDRLNSEGCLELVLRSPPPEMEGRRWLGITIPQTTSRLRAEMLSFRLAVFPQSLDGADVVFQCEMYDPLTFGVNRVVKLFWSGLATKLIPLIGAMQSRFTGSALGQQYAEASETAAHAREAFREVRNSLRSFVDQQR